ncbi:MAG TPA: glycoside hydrolase family 5 protein [Acidimicrobiales bacterium]|nr:glycoside hydrolase family 5 protein [Acidimicrobiales bacterium]
MRRARRVLVATVIAAVAASVPSAQAAPQSALSIAVVGNHLVNQDGQTVVLRGVNTSGTEYACVSEHSIFDGAQEASEGSIAAMQSWGFNAARVQLNESCWLGIQGVPAADSGQAYQRAIEQYVDQLNAAGMYVIIDMHWSSTGGRKKATRQQPMPDERYAPTFWTSVADAFKGNGAVIFDLFNEPYPNHNTDSPAAWTCVLRGSAGHTCRGFRFEAAGMQQLLDAVRATGARNVVMTGGPQYAGDLDDWSRYEPVDPIGQLAASIHIYWDTPVHPDYAPCYGSSCWTGALAPLATRVPVVVGEFGELDCGDTLYPPMLNFADAHGISYLAWAWFVGSCSKEPSLISNYDGAPTAYGVGYRQHLLSLVG